MKITPRFRRYIGIDYSGAETPNASLKGLRVYQANGADVPAEVEPPPSPRKYWTRKEIAHWLAATLADGVPTIAGIDHGFSFPLQYFETHHLPSDWPNFLDDFQRHWPTDEDDVHVDLVRDGVCGDGAERSGESHWRRITERGSGSARAVFHFDVPGSVAKATHAGIPWLRFLRRELGTRLHCWPFDGWLPPAGVSVLAEVYPALWNHAYPPEGRTPDQHDAYCVSRWLQESDRNGKLAKKFTPALETYERIVGRVEGWILGVG